MATVPVIQQKIRGACPHDCPDTCAVITTVENGKAVKFEGDPDHPITRGWLCAKVRPYLDRVYHPERLQYPMRRVGPKGSGEWQRISWDEAIDEIATRWRGIIAESGPAAILPYSYSGVLGLVQSTVSSSRFWNRLGASGLDRNICDAAAAIGMKATFGVSFGHDARDLADTKFLILWGTNPASTSPHLMPFIREAQKNGCFVVVIDPRKSLTARSADLHLQLFPSTDGALALGMINYLFANDLHDETWLNEHTVGWRELRERATEYPLERVAAITGIQAEIIADVARRFATTKPSLLKTNDGVQRHVNSGQGFRAIMALATLPGQIGTHAAGFWYSTSGYGAWNAEAVTHAGECTPPPRVVPMIRLGAALNGEVNDPPIRSLFVFNANPVTSTPDTGAITRGLLRDDLFTVVHDIFMTDTARYADIVLPATTQLEQNDLHKASGQRFYHFNNRAIAPRFEAVSNWDLMRKLATAMGFTEPWLHQTDLEVIEEIITATAETNPYAKGITFEQLQRDGVAELNFDELGRVPYASGVFPTPSGKIELMSSMFAARGLDPLPVYEPLPELVNRPENDDRLLILSAASHHFTSSSMANMPKLERIEGTPYVEIHPDDAAVRGIADGDPVRLENERGWTELRAVISTDTQRGVAVAPKGRWAQRSPGGRGINWLTSANQGDTGGHATFHTNFARIVKAESPLESGANRVAIPAD